MEDDAKIWITPPLELDEFVHGARGEGRRLRGVFPAGENGVAEKFVHHAAGGFNRVSALPQPGGDGQAEGIGVQLAAQAGVALDVHHEQPAHRVGAHDDGGGGLDPGIHRAGADAGAWREPGCQRNVK